MQESAISDRTVPAYLNSRQIFETDIDVAKPIVANLYKGLGGGVIPANGVIECKKKDQQ